MTVIRTLGLAGAVLSLTAVSAVAHHPMGGATPLTLWQGFASGVGHPVIGLDHLAFIIAVGLMAGLSRRWVSIPLAFIAGTALGCILHLASVSLPAAEILIAASVLLMGALVAKAVSLPTLATLALVAVAGLAHGHAYGEGIFGAEGGPLYAYLAGFCAIQFAIAATTAVLASRALAASAEARGVRTAGALIAGVGVAMVWGQMLPIAFPGMAG